MPSPTLPPRACQETKSSATEALTYISVTLWATSPTAALAKKYPRLTPSREAMSDTTRVSVRKSRAIWERLPPTARRMPISLRRCTTAMETAL